MERTSHAASKDTNDGLFKIISLNKKIKITCILFSRGIVVYFMKLPESLLDSNSSL